jgi:hypothetical protein
MKRSYLKGFRTALLRWPLAFLLFAATALPGLVFAATAWLWLAAALDKSLATRTLLTDLDMNVFVDLIGHHGESLWMLLLGGALLVAACWLLGVWLNATTIAAVADDTPLAAAARRGLDLYVTFLGLGLVALAVDALLILGTVGVGRWLIQATANTPSETTVSLIVGGGAGVAGSLVLCFTTIHDHARIHSAATGSGAAAAYVWAVGFVTRREPRAVPLALLLLATGVGVWLVYQTVGTLFVTTWTPAIVLSVLWGEALIFSRMFLRLWGFAAQTELQNMRDAAVA